MKSIKENIYKIKKLIRNPLKLLLAKKMLLFHIIILLIVVFDIGITLGVSNGTLGNSFIVAKGKFVGNYIKEAAVFMHELGHTLGLIHGGQKMIIMYINLII